MSAKPQQRNNAIRLAVMCGLVACGLPAVADDEQPDMEFLEYLGSWEESDADWQLLIDTVSEIARDEERSDPAPDGEESTESRHES